MRIYVACSFAHKDAAGAVMGMAEARGHKVTHDWTHDLWADEESLANMAENCLNGVRAADGLIVILTDDARGTLCEWGAALALRKPVVCVCPDFTQWHKMIFYWHSDVWLSTTIDGALDTLEEMVSERRAPLDALGLGGARD